MDRPPHDFPAASAMAFAQQQQQQQFGFPPQPQQYPPSVHGSPFLPPHPSLQQYPFHRQPPPQSLHPHLLHLQQQHPPPNFAPHLPPHLVQSPPFTGPYDSSPPPVPPPLDPDLHKRIDKLAEYVVKNGPEFEAMVRDKEQDKPEYSFLFGGEGHGYYRYKLWVCARPSAPFSVPFPSSMPMMHPPSNSMINPPGPSLTPSGTGASAPLLGPSQMHQLPFPSFYDQQHQHFMGPGRPDYDPSSKPFRCVGGPLPTDVSMELSNVLGSLTGTKESIKGAKMWFMQRSPFAPALAEALRERVFLVDDSEKQLHIIYLANDILFDSLQRRANVRELDNEALSFKPVIGSMLGRIYHNPHNQEENQSRLKKILQFWASKEVYDEETIHKLEAEMLGGPPATSGPPRDLLSLSTDVSANSGLQNQNASSTLPQWLHDKRPGLLNQEHHPDRHGVPLAAAQPGQPFSMQPVLFPGSVPLTSPGLPSIAQQQPPAIPTEKLPPYPLFPPGLIPGMVRKQQIGSGVPYSPMSPLDIPTVIPPSDVPESETLERVSKFFKEIGEVNPSEGPMGSSEGRYEDEYERDSPVRKGGACIPPPPNLQVIDPETGTYADGSVDRKAGGSGRLGLGAMADPTEISQYDDVYTSYRKQRSTNYHSTMSARAATR